MSGRGSMRRAARLCAAAMLPLASAALAQGAPASDPAELDPSAPLDPLPDLGVEWPDLNARDSSATAPAPAQPHPTDESASQIRYTWVLEGLAGVGDAEDLLKGFKQQSALEADRKDSANAAQI